MYRCFTFCNTIFSLTQLLQVKLLMLLEKKKEKKAASLFCLLQHPEKFTRAEANTFHIKDLPWRKDTKSVGQKVSLSWLFKLQKEGLWNRTHGWNV